MAFRENIKIEERLTIHVKDISSGKVTSIDLKVPDGEKSLFQKFMEKVGFRKPLGTVSDYGKEMAAKLYGAVATGTAINQIGASISGGAWVWKSATPTYTAVGTLVVQNSVDPWTAQENYVKIGCRNSGGGTDYHNEIAIVVNCSGGDTLTWWAEIQFDFSG